MRHLSRCVSVYVGLSVSLCVCVFVCVCVYMSVCVCVCVSLYPTVCFTGMSNSLGVFLLKGLQVYVQDYYCIIYYTHRHTHKETHTYAAHSQTHTELNPDRKSYKYYICYP